MKSNALRHRAIRTQMLSELRSMSAPTSFGTRVALGKDATTHEKIKKTAPPASMVTNWMRSHIILPCLAKDRTLSTASAKPAHTARVLTIHCNAQELTATT